MSDKVGMKTSDGFWARVVLPLVAIGGWCTVYFYFLENLHLHRVMTQVRSEVAEEKLKLYEQVRTFAKVASTADHYLLLIKSQAQRAEENTNRIQEMEMRMRKEK